MEVVGGRSFASYFSDDHSEEQHGASVTRIRRGSGHTVHSFFELAKKTATLQFLNREHVLLFRGQATDWQYRRSTTLKPSILRPESTALPSSAEVARRYRVLRACEKKLIQLFNQNKLQGRSHIERRQILRWSILQHYEVCRTPLIDFTQSLRVAASFATRDTEQGFVYVIAVPSLTGAVSVSADASLQVVRLLSACPPSAMRPHLQEGYLLGEYPDLGTEQSASAYKPAELDFGRRLVAKFKVPNTIWNKYFLKLENRALYPSSGKDPIQEMLRVMQAVKTQALNDG